MNVNNPKQTDILLESGTNELEILEFTISDQIFAINVAKVKEIMMIAPITPMQKSHPNIEGIFKPRDTVLTVIDLAGYLGLVPSEAPLRDILIITNFNNRDFAFHIHKIVGIDRISWSQMKKPDTIIYGGGEGIATGIAEYENRLITILDFEKIVTEISPETGIQYSDLDQLGERVHSDKTILIAEDSVLLSKMLLESLHRAGYSNVIKTDNGEEAWTWLNHVKESGDPVKQHVSCLISDIEMPIMDGHRLTKLVKSDPVLSQIPVILFSSLISDEMRVKGELVGADEQITKPEIVRLVKVVDQLTSDQ